MSEPYPQTESEWEDLRTRLCAQYPEDQVQTTLLHLLEKQAQGEPLLTEPLYWCRQDAAHDIVDELEKRTHRQEAIKPGLPFPTHTPATQETYVETKRAASEECRTLRAVSDTAQKRRRRGQPQRAHS